MLTAVWANKNYILGRLFWVDLIKCVSNVRTYIRPSVHRNFFPISVKFGI